MNRNLRAGPSTLIMLLATFAIAVTPWLCAQAGSLNVVAKVQNPSILEGLDDSVTFHVTNNSGGDLIVDYALAIINGPPDPEDNITFTGVTFPTIIPDKKPGDFIYGLTSSRDNPFDRPDNGLNHISFYLGMSPSAGGTPAILNAQGLGTFFFFNNGPGSTGTLIPATLTLLQNCYNNPGAFPNPCTILPTDLLYTGEVQGQPFPTVADVTVYDVPEPAGLTLLAGALALVLVWLGRGRITSRA